MYYKRNGFERGFCRVLDLGAKNKKTLNVTGTRKSDGILIAGDWKNVGKGIETSVAAYGKRACRW